MRTDPAHLQRGDSLGRYVILSLVGTGGMGVVYAAYDPDLDRKVALKVLRSTAKAVEERRARLLREAQAMARLHHPNVVSVFDVGTLEGQVFVAMELVSGVTLRAWLRQRPRPWREVLRVFLEAARGLGAAHAAGLVHRDFKPDNVLVSEDGRVLVTDFGLARALMSSDIAPDPHETPSSSSTWNDTRTGAVLGTPAYMAPEQLRGEPTDERSDVFAFCVALHEGLTGKRPSLLEAETRTMAEGHAPMQVGPIEVRGLPRRVRRILVRGLEVNPARRPASMQELAAALVQAQRRRAPWIAAALGAAGTVAAALYAALAGEPPCTGAASRLAGVWDDTRRAEVARAFRATGASYAEDAWRIVDASLGAYAGDWARMHTEACLATRVRRTQSEALLDRRMVCLEQRLADLGAFARVLAAADALAVQKAPLGARQLPSLRPCAEPETLLGVVALPDDPGVRKRAAGLRARIAEASAQRLAGRYRDGEGIAAPIVADARALGHAPLTAQAQALHADLLEKIGDYTRSVESWKAAILSALAGRDARTAAYGWVEIIWAESELSLSKESLEHARFAEAFLAGMGGDLELEAQLESNVAAVLGDMGRYEESYRRYLACADKRERALGPDHPALGTAYVNLGVIRSRQGRVEESVTLMQRALAIQIRALGPRHPIVGHTLFNLANSLLDARHPDARARAEEAVAILRAAHGEVHAHVASAVHALGMIASNEGRYAEAEKLARQALEIGAKTRSQGNRMLFNYRVTLAEALFGLRRYREALATFREAHEGFRALEGDGPFSAMTLLGIGKSLRALESPREAIPIIERSFSGLLPENRGYAAMELARALLAVGQRRLARQRAEEALRIFEPRLPRTRTEVAEVRELLRGLGKD